MQLWIPTWLAQVVNRPSFKGLWPGPRHHLKPEDWQHHLLRSHSKTLPLASEFLATSEAGESHVKKTFGKPGNPTSLLNSQWEFKLLETYWRLFGTQATSSCATLDLCQEMRKVCAWLQRHMSPELLKQQHATGISKSFPKGTPHCLHNLKSRPVIWMSFSHSIPIHHDSPDDLSFKIQKWFSS